MIRLEPRTTPSRTLALMAPVGAVIVSLALAAIPLLAAGQNLFEAYRLMFQGAFGSAFAFSETLTRATPLILTGLAAAVAFRAKLWNIGGEGQFYLGALAAVIVGTGAVSGPAWVLVPLVMLAGASAGAVGLIGPAYLKTRFKTDEVVTTLLLNFIILLIVQMVLQDWLKDPMSLGWPQSEPIVDAATLPALFAKYRVHAGLLVSLAAAALIYVLMRHTVLGFELRAVGENPHAARHAGISVNGTMLKAAAISGALAGLAGTSEVIGLKGYLTSDLSPGFGYAGIVVAMLARLSPVGVVISSIFIAGVFVGADSMSRAIGVSSYLADLVVAVALLSVLVAGFSIRYRIRWMGLRGGEA